MSAQTIVMEANRIEIRAAEKFCRADLDRFVQLVELWRDMMFPPDEPAKAPAGDE